MSAAAPRPARLLLMAGGFVIWSGAFVVLYGALSVGCELGWHETFLAGPLTLQRAMLVILFVLSVAAGAAWIVLLARSARESEGTARFIDRVSLLVAWAGLGSIVFSFFAVFGLSSCH